MLGRFVCDRPGMEIIRPQLSLEMIDMGRAEGQVRQPVKVKKSLAQKIAEKKGKQPVKMKKTLAQEIAEKEEATAIEPEGRTIIILL